MKLSRASVALYVGLIFVSGFVLGVFGHRLYTVNSVDANSVRHSPEEWRKRYTAEMQSRLQLRSDQLSQLNTILDETRQAFQQVREKMRPEMDSIRDGQVTRIRSILDDRQKLEYEKMRLEREQKMKRSGAGSGPGF